jgi:ABC-type phosphate/phosphonate transport system substrate-binding protein
MFASLPMYDRPENQAAHDTLWNLIRDGLRAAGIAAPDALDRSLSHDDGWSRPDLVLGQICNLPYRARFRDRVTVIGASDYGLDGTAPGYYRSLFIVRADDPAQTLTDAMDYPFAYNEPLSNSGWGLPQQHAMAQGRSLNPTLRTGAHVESLRAVAGGKADLAAIDAVTLRNLRRSVPEAALVRVIGETMATPGMSFITRAGQDPAPYRTAIAAAIAALPADAAANLGLRGIVTLSPTAYDLPMPPAPVVSGGAMRS